MPNEPGKTINQRARRSASGDASYNGERVGDGSRLVHDAYGARNLTSGDSDPARNVVG